MLFSLSLWQGLRLQPGKEGGGKKVSREKQEADGREPDRRVSEQEEAERNRLSMSRAEEGFLFCSILVLVFEFGFVSGDEETYI